jgi:restriction system protein
VPLFVHGYSSPLATIEAVSVNACMFCGGTLHPLVSEQRRHEWDGVGPGHQGQAHENASIHTSRCQKCGWWLHRHVRDSVVNDHGFPHWYRQVWGAAGCLKQLDLTAPDAPLDEIRAFLMGRYERRHSIDSFRFEELVGSVYRDLGYHTLVTNRRGDKGIDVFLRKGESTIGVQVKRYRDAVDVAKIRELSGALFYHGLTKGIFVTTSRFTTGATEYVEGFLMRGQEIQLVDADAFYDALEIAQPLSLQQFDNDIQTLATDASRLLTYESKKIYL